VPEFLGIHDRAHDVDCAVRDVQAEHIDQTASGVEALGTRLAVDLDGLQLHVEPVGNAE